MVMIQKIEDFKVDFAEDYELNGHKFSIEVQYRGTFLDDDFQIAPVTVRDDEWDSAHVDNVWVFKLWVSHELVLAGPYRRRVSDGALTPNEVANHLAEYWSKSDFEKLIRDSRTEKASMHRTFDQIVWNCKQYVRREPLMDWGMNPASDEPKVVFANQDAEGWIVLLDSVVNPGYGYRFSQKKGASRVSVETFIKAHQTHTSF